MIDKRQERSALWTFPPGTLGRGSSIKHYTAEAADGNAGKVAWASYAPGESYLVITRRKNFRKRRYIVPAGVVSQINHARRAVVMRVKISDIETAPEHKDTTAPLDPAIVAAFAGDVWRDGMVL